MKNNLLVTIIFFCFLCSACQNKKEKNIIKHLKYKIAMKKFDIERFNNKKGIENELSYVEDDTIVTLKRLAENNDYCEIKKSIKDNFIKKNVYDSKTHLLKSEGNLFYRFPIGKHNFYNENGVLTKEINYDEGYTFTVNDFISKVKQEYNIDLNTDVSNVNFGRSLSKNGRLPVYGISFKINDEKIRYIEINGINGEVVKDEIINSD